MRRIVLAALLLTVAAATLALWPGGETPRSRDNGTKPCPLGERADGRDSASPERESAEDEAHLRIAGLVTDAAGDPLEGVEVQFNNNGVTAITDADGTFSSPPLLNHVERLGIRKSGYADATTPRFPGDLDVRVVLHPAASVDGILIGPEGDPISGARVQTGMHVTESGPDGRFRLDRLEPGHHIVRARFEASSDGATAAQTIEEIRKLYQGIPEHWKVWTGCTAVDVAAGETVVGIEVHVKTSEYSWFDLRVVDEAGHPRAGLRLRPVIRGGEHRWMTETDEQGRWRGWIRRPPGRRCWFAVGPEERELVLRSQHLDEEMAQIVIPSMREVRFRVRDSRGKTLRAPAIEIRGIATPLNAVVEIKRPDAESDHCIVKVAPHDGDGPYRWCVRAAGYLPATGVARLPDANEIIDVSLARAGRVSARVVTADGGPIPVTYVRIGRTVQCTHDAGLVEFDEVPEGVHLVVAGNIGENAVVSATVRAGEHLDLGDLQLEPAPIVTGAVVDSSGKPVGGALIRILWHEWHNAVWTKPDGSFSVRVDDPEGLWMHAYRDGQASELVRVGPNDAPRFVLHEAGSIRITLRRACRWVRLLAPPDAPIALRDYSDTGDEQAETIMHGVPLGDLFVEFWDLGVKPVRKRVTVHPGEIAQVEGP